MKDTMFLHRYIRCIFIDYMLHSKTAETKCKKYRQVVRLKEYVIYYMYLAILNIPNACMASDKQNDSVDRIVIAARINPISK